jgi:DNA-binding NarL/FixJ family response regulator
MTHAIVRRGIVEILTERSDLKVVSESADCGQLRAQMRQHGEVDLLVMDVSQPGKDGIEILKALHGA